VDEAFNMLNTYVQVDNAEQRGKFVAFLKRCFEKTRGIQSGLALSLGFGMVAKRGTRSGEYVRGLIQFRQISQIVSCNGLRPDCLCLNCRFPVRANVKANNK